MNESIDSNDSATEMTEAETVVELTRIEDEENIATPAEAASRDPGLYDDLRIGGKRSCCAKLCCGTFTLILQIFRVIATFCVSLGAVLRECVCCRSDEAEDQEDHSVESERQRHAVEIITRHLRNHQIRSRARRRTHRSFVADERRTRERHSLSHEDQEILRNILIRRHEALRSMRRMFYNRRMFGFALANRDLTPEDYDILLSLDRNVNQGTFYAVFVCG